MVSNVVIFTYIIKNLLLTLDLNYMVEIFYIFHIHSVGNVYTKVMLFVAFEVYILNYTSFALFYTLKSTFLV